MPSASALVMDLDCTNCGKPLVKDGKVKCPRCKQDIELPVSLSGLPEGKWRCPECRAHGFKSRHVLAVDRKVKCRWCKEDQNSLVLVQREKKVTKKKQEKEVKFSCREARLVLKVMKTGKEYEVMTSEEKAACRHYASCNSCKKLGLSRIVSWKMSCKEALETWATRPGPLYLGLVQTVKEQLALEHVWGRLVEGVEDTFWARVGHFEICQVEHTCRRLWQYWKNAGLSMFNDGEGSTAGEIPFLIEVFIDKGFPLKKLLEIQKQRVETLLKAMQNNDPVSVGYGEVGYIVCEIEANVKSLQDWTIKSTPGLAEK